LNVFLKNSMDWIICCSRSKQTLMVYVKRQIACVLFVNNVLSYKYYCDESVFCFKHNFSAIAWSFEYCLKPISSIIEANIILCKQENNHHPQFNSENLIIITSHPFFSPVLLCYTNEFIVLLDG
jgi:hypothetical protein